MAATIPRSTILMTAASVGGVALVFIILAAVYMIVKCQRRRRLPSNQIARDRRLSRYPGGHLSLTPSEADRNRPPRTPRHLASARSPYGFWEGWQNVGSRDSLSRRSMMSGTSRSTALSISYPDLQVISNDLPRPPPAARIRHHASSSLKLSPITERGSRDSYETHPRSQDRTREMINLSQNTVSTQDLAISGSRDGQYPKRSRPKHYIRTHRRSVSTGPLQTIRDVLPANDLGQPLGDEIRSTMTRTFGLRRQPSGVAPIVRMESPPPELPREIPRWSRVQALRSHSKDPDVRASTGSSVSLSSSLYDDDVFHPPVRNEIDLGSIGLLVELDNELPMSSSEATTSWNGHETQTPGTAVLSNSFELARTRFHLQQRQSCGSSIERHPLSRNPSSGLTPSLVDQYGPSRRGSSASSLDMFNKDIFSSSDNHQTMPLDNSEDPSTSTPISILSSSPKLHLTHFNSTIESPLRASLSVLQETSGNKSSLDDITILRPSSDPTTQTFTWDETAGIKPGKPSSLKARDQGHKRQSRQRISFDASRTSSIAFEPTMEELANDKNISSQAPTLPGLFLTSPQQERLSPRPPSVLTFEPWLKPPSTPGRGRQRDLGDYSKVVSVYESYNMERGASSEDLLSTPTRKPSSEEPYKRSSSIVPGTPSHPLWLLRKPFTQKGPQSGIVDGPQIVSTNDKTPLSSTSQAAEKGPVFDRHTPKYRPARGTRFAATRRSPTRRSPGRGSPLRGTGRSPTRPLALAVMNQLRKKNSEIFDSDATYYMNILPSTPEKNDTEGLELVTPKRNFPILQKTGESGPNSTDSIWRNIDRENEVVGLGITADFESSDHSSTPETIHKHVEHFP